MTQQILSWVLWNQFQTPSEFIHKQVRWHDGAKVQREVPAGIDKRATWEPNFEADPDERDHPSLRYQAPPAGDLFNQ
jgi:hypothetical protein